ncbi:MAG: hypothetical protein H7837_14320 [Magnetococcus sp. MYC-9]
MVRFLLILVGVVVGVRLLWPLVQRWLRPAPPPVAGQEEPHTLVRCSRCGTLIPQDQLVWQGERPYCGVVCRDATGA